ncbi:MAG: hypothetical protein WKF77_26675 [Planctomycetaceae bacterium]
MALLTLGVLRALAGPAAFAATIDIGGPRTPGFRIDEHGRQLCCCRLPGHYRKTLSIYSELNLVLLLFAGVYFARDLLAICEPRHRPWHPES